MIRKPSFSRFETNKKGADSTPSIQRFVFTTLKPVHKPDFYHGIKL